MLDNEPDTDNQPIPEQPSAESTAPQPRRRRAASRPAGPPSSAPDAPPIEPVEPAPEPEPAVADATSTVVLHDELERAFRHLTPEHRAVVVLTHLDDLSMQETAEALGIPVGTAKSRLHHALEKLRKMRMNLPDVKGDEQT